MKTLILFSSVAAAVTLYYLTAPTQIHSFSFLQERDEVTDAYIAYLAKYGRSYASKQEHLRRFSAFKANYQNIATHNS